jgi:hypothetical protein
MGAFNKFCRAMNKLNSAVKTISSLGSTKKMARRARNKAAGKAAHSVFKIFSK